MSYRLNRHLLGLAIQTVIWCCVVPVAGAQQDPSTLLAPPELHTESSVHTQQPQPSTCQGTPTYEPCDARKGFDAVDTIDAARGTTASGRHRFNRRDRVQLIVVNKNPFLYRYVITLSEKTVSSPDAAALAQQLGVWKALPTSGQAQSPSAQATPQQNANNGGGQNPPGPAPRLAQKNRRANVTATCDNDPNVAAASAGVAGVKSSVDDVAHRFSDPQQRLTHIDSLVRVLTPRLNNPAALAKDLFADGTVLADSADATRLALGALVDATPQFQRDTIALINAQTTADTLIRAINQLTGTYTQCGLLLDDAKTLSDTRVSDTAMLAFGRVAPVRRKSVDSLAVNTRGVISNPLNFWQGQSMGDYDSATVTTVVVSRTTIKDASAAKTDTVARDAFKFGSPRFIALAAGPGIAGVLSRTYVRVQGKATDTSTTLTPLVGYGDQSNFHIPALAFIHLRVADIGRSGTTFHLTLGSNVSTSAREWFPGISVGFADERLFLTAGPYVSSVQYLEGRLKIGDPLPSSLAEIPTKSRGAVGYGFGLSYRIQ